MINNSNISLGIILGSGIGLNEDLYSSANVIIEETSGIHHKIVFTCKIAGKNIIVFKGRKHFYEGHSLNEITSNIQLAQKLNVKNLFITNAAGGVNESFCQGDLMLITSHINFIDKMILKKSAFPYSKVLAEKFRKICSSMGVKLQEGVYGCYAGPMYETKAEVKMQKKFLIDAAGMSTVPEVLEAKNIGMNIIAVSVITNMLSENPAGHTLHSNVLSAAANASSKLNLVLPKLISELN